MRHLWVRLSMAFVVVVFISFITVLLLSFLIIQANIDPVGSAERLRAPDGLVDTLTTYYETQRSWDGVETLFAGVESVYRFGPNTARAFSLVDNDGGIIYGSAIRDDQNTVTTIPIEIAGQAQATLTIIQNERPGINLLIGRIPGLRIQLQEGVLLITFVGGVIGVLFGVLTSRTLTQPLDDLARAAADIGAYQLDRRVVIEGSTEIVILAQAFNLMAEKLERAEQLRRNMVADIAHELRTPLTGLQTTLYAILDDAYPMTKTEIAGLYDQTRLLSRLVSDLHELSLAEARQLPLNRQSVNLGKTLEEFIAPFRSMTDNKNVTLLYDVPTRLPLVSVDMERINQVLHNLLGNALRHTPPEGTISIQVDHDETCLYIAVKDTGEGIGADHLPNVFERFYRADYGRSRQAGGTGLGLAIAKAIVEAHDGKITIASTGVPGQGATFSVQLPLKGHENSGHKPT